MLDNFKSVSDKKLDLLVLITLSVIVIISRISFMSKFLYDEDSVGYALAFTNYNIALHQPHPPGYILLIALGKAINVLFNDPNLSIIFINILFTILTIVFIYFLAKQMISRKFAIITALLLIFNPIFWVYGEISTSYLSAALFATLIALTSYRVLKGDSRFIYISALVLGLAGGFRQDIILFMFPLWLYCLIYKNREPKRIVLGLVILAVTALLWFIPTIILTGGYETYSAVARRLFLISFSVNSVLFGADVSNNINMGFRVLYWSIVGIGIANIFILLFYIIFKIKSFKLSLFRNSTFIFFALWIIPALIFFLLVLFAKPGYILLLLPTFALIMAYVILNFSTDLNSRFNKVSTNTFIIILLSISLVSGVIQFTNPSENGLYQIRIQSVDQNFQDISDSIKLFKPENTVIFSDNDVTCRKVNYYFPDFESYCYTTYANNKSPQEFTHYKNGKTKISQADGFDINLNSSTTRILWIVDANSPFFKSLESKIEIKTLELSNGYKIYYSDVNNNTNFDINGFTIKKA